MSGLYGEDRPALPAELRRRVLVESGHRCAIPTCRYIDVDIHHIVPWMTRLSHEYENLIALCPNCHRRADKGEIDRKALRNYKLNLRFIHEKYSQLEMDMLFELYRAPAGTGAPWVPFMMIFFKRILESNFVELQRSASGFQVSIAGVDSTPTFLLITQKGREFIQDLGLHEL